MSESETPRLDTLSMVLRLLEAHREMYVHEAVSQAAQGEVLVACVALGQKTAIEGVIADLTACITAAMEVDFEDDDEPS